MFIFYTINEAHKQYSLLDTIFNYPVRCAHIPPPCHFTVCFDLLVFLTSRVLFFTSKVTKLSIIFEARSVILEARGPIWTISVMVVCFYKNKCLRGPPPRCPWTHFLRSREVFFFECRCFWIFGILSARRLHSGFHFDSFWGALDLLKNSSR